MISRPISWPNTAFPFAAAYLASGGRIDITFIIGTLYFLIPYNLMMYGINDVFDYESDIQNPRKGGIEGMREQRKFHPTIIRATWYVNLPLGIYLLLAGNVASALLLLGVVALALAYSVPKLRFKERPGLDSLTSSLHFVGPMLFGFSLISWPDAWLQYTVAFGLWGIASHAFGAIQDILPDRKAHIHSIATYIGARATLWLSGIFYLITTGIIVSQGGPTVIIALFGLLYAVNLTPFLSITDRTSAAINAAWRRFLWLNYLTGFALTLILLIQNL